MTGFLLAAWGLARARFRAAWALLRLAVTLPLGVLLAAALAGFLAGSCQGEARYKAAYAKGVAAGVKAERADWQKVAEKLKEIRRKLESRTSAISADERTKLDRRLTDNHAHFTNLRKEVRAHVTPADDARCIVPLGFVRTLNRGLAGRDRRAPELPGAAGRPDAAASGLALSDVADQLLGGFEAPYAWRAEADAWRGWYPRVCAEWRAAGGACDGPP